MSRLRAGERVAALGAVGPVRRCCSSTGSRVDRPRRPGGVAYAPVAAAACTSAAGAALGWFMDLLLVHRDRRRR